MHLGKIIVHNIWKNWYCDKCVEVVDKF